MAQELASILLSHDNTKSNIRVDRNACFLWNQSLEILEKHKELAHIYCLERDKARGPKFDRVKVIAMAELRCIFGSYVRIMLMSSYGSNTYLMQDSDIDIGVILEVDDEEYQKNSYLNDLLNAGYQFDTFSLYGYYIYTKVINGIEIEVKIRKASEWTTSIIRLHEKLDGLPRDIQDLITYGKFLLQGDKELYDKFKSLVYCNYYTQVMG